MKALWVINVLILQVWKQAAPSPLPRFPPKKDADASSLPERRLLCGVRIKENWVKISWDHLRNRRTVQHLFTTIRLYKWNFNLCQRSCQRWRSFRVSSPLKVETQQYGNTLYWCLRSSQAVRTDESPVSFTNVAALTLLMLVLLKSHTSKTCRRKMEGSMESCSRLFSVCFNQIFV